MSGIWSHKFYNANDLHAKKKIYIYIYIYIGATEQNGLRITQFQTLEWSGIKEALLKWLKQDRSENVLVSGPLLMIAFVLPKFKVNVFLE
jgi:hypothetical protein